MAARCVGVFSKIATMETMSCFLEHVLPWFGAIDDRTKQEGAIEAMACILHTKMQVYSVLVYIIISKLFTDSIPANLRDKQ